MDRTGLLQTVDRIASEAFDQEDAKLQYGRPYETTEIGGWFGGFGERDRGNLLAWPFTLSVAEHNLAYRERVRMKLTSPQVASRWKRAAQAAFDYIRRLDARSSFVGKYSMGDLQRSAALHEDAREQLIEANIDVMTCRANIEDILHTGRDRYASVEDWQNDIILWHDREMDATAQRDALTTLTQGEWANVSEAVGYRLPSLLLDREIN